MSFTDNFYAIHEKSKKKKKKEVENAPKRDSAGNLSFNGAIAALEAGAKKAAETPAPQTANTNDVAKVILRNNPTLIHEAVYGNENKVGADFNAPQNVQRTLGLIDDKIDVNSLTNGFAPINGTAKIRTNPEASAIEKPQYKEVLLPGKFDLIQEQLAVRNAELDELRKQYPTLTDEELIEVWLSLKQKEAAKETPNTSNGTWFSSGGFNPDHPIESIVRGIGGTVLDVIGNVGSGIIEIGENVIDAGAYVVGGVGGMFSDDFQNDTKRFIQKDLWDADKPSRGVDDISFLGEKSDSLAQSGGQLVGTVGLQAVGVPWFVTSGATAFGSSAEGALNEGASYGEAGAYGAISAATEILTEKLFKGSGLGESGLFDTSKVTKNISNKLVKSLADYGVDIAAEGSEEVVSQFATNLASALYKEENLTELLFGDEALESYIDSFIGGSVLGGGMNAGKVANSINTKTDYNTGVTANEQKVIDKEIENRIAEAEADGKTLTKKDKTAIEEQVYKDLEKGYISTDTIESVLGGEAYNSYQDSVNKDNSIAEQEKAIEDEIAELVKTPESQFTIANRERLTELREMRENLDKTSNTADLKTKLDEAIANILKGERKGKGSMLFESYNEQTRRGKAFEADVSKYAPEQQAVIQKAIDSGILNNTNRTHDFVDMVAKISADKGVLFDFANNEKLKQSGFALDGKTVNGYVTKDGITLNIDSHKALNSVVGHEITHVLEGTELYTELQNTLFEYAKTKGEYDSRLANLTELYKGVKDADVNAELTADLAGDYLFTDGDFVTHLSTTKRNVFQKIYDEIKYLYKTATAGSKEARELERVKRAFDKAYKESGTAQSGTKYSVSDSDGKQLTAEQSEYFKDSKMRDDNGNLKVMYHGSQDAGFHVFDSSMSDDDTSFFFVDRNDVATTYSGTSETYAPKAFKTAEDANRFFAEIGQTDYEVVEENGKYTLLDGGDEVAISDSLDEIYEEWRDWSGLGYGDANYKVYLNLTNPLEIDAKGRPWNKIDAEFSQEIYDRYQSLTAEEKAALTDLTEWEDFSLFNREIQEARGDELASAYEKLGGDDANIYDIFTIAADNFNEETLKENAVKYLKTRDFAQRAKEQGYDGVIFKNIVDNGGYSSGDEGASTVAVAFSPEQIKSVGNDKPTANKDIRYSLSEDSNGKELSANQQKFFELSKIRDDNGKLKLMYHGSPATFTAFDKNKARSSGYYGRGFYFTDSDSHAKQYGNTYEVYLNITNPIKDGTDKITKEQLRKFVEAIAENEDYGIDNYGYGATVDSVVDSVFGKSDFAMLMDLNVSCVGDMVAAIELFNEINGTNYDGIVTPTETVAFYPEQIKSVTNQSPTSDSNIYNSLSAEGEAPKRYGNYNVYGEDIRLEKATTEENAISPLQSTTTKANTMENSVEDFAPITEDEANAMASESLDSLTDADVPPEIDAPYYAPREPITIDSEGLKKITDSVNSILYLNGEDSARMAEAIKIYAQNPNLTREQLAEHISKTYEVVEEIDNSEIEDELNQAKKHIRGTRIYVPEETKAEFNGRRKDGYNAFRQEHLGHFILTNNPNDMGIDSLYQELSDAPENGGYPNLFPADIVNPADQLNHIAEVASRKIEPEYRGMPYDEDTIQEAVNAIESGIAQYSQDDMLRGMSEEQNATAEYYGAKPITEAPIAKEAQTKQPTGKPVSREVFAERMNEVYGKIKNLSSGKYHKVDDYGFSIARAKDGHATITIKTPDGQKLQRRISEGAYWKNDKLWREAARMVAENQYPNVEQITTDEAKKAKIITDEPEVKRPKPNFAMWARKNLVDEYSVFEDLALKTGNRELDAKANFMRYSGQMAQRFIGKGTKDVRAIADVQAEVEKSGHRNEFQEYMYDMLNIDRMSIEGNAAKVIERVGEKFKDLRPEQIHAIAAKEITDKTTERTAQTIRDAREYLWAIDAKNLPVYGYEYTAEMSREAVAKAEAEHPEFKKWAQDVYSITNYLRDRLVRDGEISQETADLWAKIYPHYVPVRRVDKQSNAISVPLDTGKTGVNAPIKRATGGDSNIGNLFKTLALRAEQTYRAGARNSFGVELMNTLGTRLDQQNTSLDADADSVYNRLETHEERLKKGEFGGKPTFTVFENGKRVEFEITKEMYDALKPKSEALSWKIPGFSHASEWHKKVLTEYNLAFSATNAIKDAQSVVVNSQHPVQTYARFPEAVGQLLTGTKGKWIKEYLENGGENLSYVKGKSKTYFDSETETFKKDDSAFKKIVGFPLKGISNINNFVEKIPRLAEYIASRKAGASIEVAMLDAARVTTNFSAGGDVTRFANRNGATFLNASVQGAAQQVRNIREAKAKGMKGILGLVGRYAAAGLPVLLFNSLMWDDDEEYAELSDYVKDNYYVVAKYGDGKFVRIPKGREVAVIQKIFQEVKDFSSGEGFDAASIADIAWTNIAPNNPVSNNVIAPIVQAHNNNAWYGGDIVPPRLQDVPADEQFDESIDAISKWLGEKTGGSPYKINYLLDQYTGIIGDMFLPMFTPEAEGGGNSFGDKLFAPIIDKFTTDSVMNNKVTSELYDLKDELTKNAKSVKATDEDILKYKYINSVNEDISELYKQQREIQNSDMTDGEKYSKVRDIQKQINDLARIAQSDYGSVSIDGVYATVGDRHYRLDEGVWTKISDKQLDRQNEVTAELGISPSEYWSKTDISFIPKKDGEYEYAYENPEKYDFLNSIGVSYDDFKNADEDTKDAYSWAYKNQGKYTMSKAISDDFFEYYGYKKDIDDIAKGNDSSKGVQDKDLITDYIFSLDLDYGQKAILYRSMYDGKKDKEKYINSIVEYLDGREDISYEDTVTILEVLGYKVDSEGYVSLAD